MKKIIKRAGSAVWARISEDREVLILAALVGVGLASVYGLVQDQMVVSRQTILTVVVAGTFLYVGRVIGARAQARYQESVSRDVDEIIRQMDR